MTRAGWRTAGVAVMLAGLAALEWQGAEGAADEKVGAEALPADLARIPTRSVALLSARYGDVWATPLMLTVREKLGKEFKTLATDEEEKTGLTPADIERKTMVMKKSFSAPPMTFIATKKAFDRKMVFGRAVPGGKEEKYSGDTIVVNNRNQAAFALSEKAFVMGTKDDIVALVNAGSDRPVGPLTPVLELAAKKHTTVISFDPSKVLVPLVESSAELAGLNPLLNARSVTLAIDLGVRKTTGTFRVIFGSAADATEGVKAVEAGRKYCLGQLAEMIKSINKDRTAVALVDVLQVAKKSVQDSTVKQEGSAVVGRLVADLDQVKLGIAYADTLTRVRNETVRLQRTNNLKQIALAMYNYEASYGHFPPQAIYSKDGKPLLSWRVTLLPFLEAQHIYNQFKLDEAWDSPHNKKLLAKMPSVYKAPNVKSTHPHGTFYQAFVGKGAFFDGKEGIPSKDITDGTANTIMLVEAAKDVLWTKPDDLLFDPAKPLPKLGGLYPKPGFYAICCDGSVRFFNKTKEATLKKYITRNGGEVIGPDE